jgi:CheY-like chemotaxis protein
MSHCFDSHALRELVEDAEHLIACTSVHERRLGDLVRRLESDSAATSSVSAVGVPSAAHWLNKARCEAPDLLASVRDLCIGAEEQRQGALMILRRVVGEIESDTHKRSLAPRILVVDDSVDTCEMAAIVLEDAGFHVITAANGLEAVLAAFLARPAVVLMDINMPVLNGIEAARLLKASTATCDLQMIAYTAKPEFYDGPVTGLFMGVLSKPSSPDAIVASVRRCIVPGSETLA